MFHFASISDLDKEHDMDEIYNELLNSDHGIVDRQLAEVFGLYTAYISVQHTILENDDMKQKPFVSHELDFALDDHNYRNPCDWLQWVYRGNFVFSLPLYIYTSIMMEKKNNK